MSEAVQVSPPSTGNALQRIATLEADAKNVKDDVADIRKKVDAIHDILMQAKGARWAIVSIAGFAGFLSGAIAKLVPFLQTR